MFESVLVDQNPHCDGILYQEGVSRFSKNLGHLLENKVYLDLKRQSHELYYYKTGGPV